MKIRVKLQDGTTVQSVGWYGGSVAKPHDLGHGLFSIDLPNQVGVMLCTNGGPEVPFKQVVVDRCIFTRGSSLDENGDVLYIPDNPDAYRGGIQSIKPFETLPILAQHDFWMPPTEASRSKIRSIVEAVTDVELMATKPRLLKLARNLDDKNQPQQTPFGDTDMGWYIRHYQYTAGGGPKEGYYNGVCPRGSGGFSNWHYGNLFWMGVNYAYNPQFSLYHFYVEQLVAHACYGHTWFGSAAGMARYEKGNDFIGQNFTDKSWEKQFTPGMYLGALLTRNPMVEMVLEMKRQQLKLSNHDTVWQSYWGARVGSHYLEELLLAWLYRPEQWLMDKAVKFMENVKMWQAPDLMWDNKGNGGAAEESPWMQVQLVSAIFRWLDVIPDTMRVPFSRDDLCEIGEAIMTAGTTRIYGKPMLKYRFRTTEVMPRSMSITAFAVPMLKRMNAHNSARFGKLYTEVSDFVFDFAGTDIAGIVSDTPTPIDELGYRFPREGHGWEKAALFYLEALR